MGLWWILRFENTGLLDSDWVEMEIGKDDGISQGIQFEGSCYIILT